VRELGQSAQPSVKTSLRLLALVAVLISSAVAMRNVVRQASAAVCMASGRETVFGKMRASMKSKVKDEAFNV